MNNIIAQSERFDVTLKVNNDYKGTPVYTVVYCLEVKQFHSLYDALAQFHNALHHAVECDSTIGEE